MLQSNKLYTFNEYLPMVEGIHDQLHREIDPATTSDTMADFIDKMRIHFDTFELDIKVKNLAWTACLLDPKHINRFKSRVVTKFVDNVVELLSDITPPESQDVVDPSQPTFQSKFEKVSAKTSKSDMSKGKTCRLSRYSDPQQG